MTAPARCLRISSPLLRPFRSVHHPPRSVHHPLTSAPPCRRYRAAHDRPPSFSPLESQLLSAALPHVPQHGFAEAALRAGARDAGLLDASPAILPRGAFDLVRYHLVTRRQALQTEVQFAEDAASGNKLGTTARVRALVLHRLRGNQDVIYRWQDALALSALPSNVPLALAELAALVDDIWHLAGDASVDFSWYTRRGALAGVYASAELFQTTDASANFAATEAFVDRRLQELHDGGKALGATTQWLGFAGRSAVNVARSKGVPI